MPADLNPQPLPPRAMRVFASNDVLWDLDKFQKALASVLDKAGHQGCTSGLQLDWHQFEEFYVTQGLEAMPVVRGQSVGLGG